MAVYAPISHKDLDAYETLIKNVTKVSWEGRRAGTDEDDSEELNETYGPLW